MKLAMSQIKLFIIRLLQNYTINAASTNNSNAKDAGKKLSETIETKDVFFNGPVSNIQVQIKKRRRKTFWK